MNRFNLLILCTLAAAPAFAQVPSCKLPAVVTSQTVTKKPVADPLLASGDIHTKVDVQPQFPGGKKALDDYVGETMVYPEYSLEHGEHGRVVVSFVIEADGNVGYTRIAGSVSPDLDAEAQRIVQNMPAWTPASVKGKPVATLYNLPINFRLPAGAKTPAPGKDVKPKGPVKKMAVPEPVKMQDVKTSEFNKNQTFKVNNPGTLKK